MIYSSRLNYRIKFRMFNEGHNWIKIYHSMLYYTFYDFVFKTDKNSFCFYGFNLILLVNKRVKDVRSLLFKFFKMNFD